MSSERLRIALQKSGRMADDSLALLKACGLHINRSKDELLCRVKELPVDLLLIRDDDIPGFVSAGICDLGIVGENVYAETKEAGEAGFQAEIAERLGFSQCRLALAMPRDAQIQKVEDLSGKTIATSYPYLLKAFLKSRGIEAKTLLMNGSVEVAPRLQIADAICDIVASGATLIANNLTEMMTVLNSEALLIRSSRKLCAAKEEVIQRLLARMRGVQRAGDSKYIMLNAPRAAVDQIAALLPGCAAPTVMELNRAGMVAVHAVCQEGVFWDTLEKLKAAGGSGILVMPIEKMMV